jgi:hypothetical protein
VDSCGGAMLGEPMGGGPAMGAAARRSELPAAMGDPTFGSEMSRSDGAARASPTCLCSQWANNADWPPVQEFDVVLLPGVSSSSREFRRLTGLQSGFSALGRLQSGEGGSLRFGWGGGVTL